MKLSATQRDIALKMEGGMGLYLSSSGDDGYYLQLNPGDTREYVDYEAAQGLINRNLAEVLIQYWGFTQFMLTDAGLKALKETE